jgi:hypothetical protein
MSENSGGNCGCGCAGIVITILVLWSLCFGLTVGESRWNIDILPPRIWDMNATHNNPVE